MKKILLAFSLLLFTNLSVIQANLIVNGGFEAPVLASGSFLTINPGSEPTGFGWSVSSGNVDLGHLPVLPFVPFNAFEGNQGLDLNGTIRGAIFQDFATVMGQAYQLTFVYADNPSEGGVSSASIRVSDVGTNNGLLSNSVTHSTSINSPGGADFYFYSGSFIASGTLTRLALASTSTSNSPSGGILLDAVNVSAVPEPSAMTLVVVCGIGLISRHRIRLLC
jgi:hypothetical protein